MADVITQDTLTTYRTKKIGSHARRMYPQDMGASVEAYFGPFDSKATAYAFLLKVMFVATNIPQGVTVGVVENGELKEYQFKKAKPAAGYTVDDLEEKGTAISVSNNIIKAKIGNDFYALTGQKIIKPATPTITVDGSATSASRKATFACATSGVKIEYSTDGGTTWAEGTSYTATASADSATSSVTVKVRASKNGETSDIATQEITTARHVAVPTITVGSDEYASSRSVTLACTTEGTTLYYTTDDTTPTTASTKYTAAFSVASSCTIKVIAVKTDWQSESASSSPTVGTLSMWWGLISADASAPSDVTTLGHQLKQKTLPATTGKITADGQNKVVFAYNKSLADLTSIKDANGTDYLTDFTKSFVGNYKVYTMKSAANQKDITYTFNA